MDDRESLIFPHPASLIGRDAELSAAIAAVEAARPQTQLLYFYGPGGVGKTSLLAATLAHVDQLRAAGRPLLESGVIDLQDVRYNQPLMLMRTIRNRLMRSLEPLRPALADAFGAFDRGVAAYRAVSMVDPSSESTQRAAIERAFKACYYEVAAHYQIVLAIDTFERLDTSNDPNERFNFRLSRGLQHWLADLIAELPNSVVLLAGRKRPAQLALLGARLGSQLTPVELGLLDPEQTRTFVNEASPEQLTWSDLLYQVSGGQPILLIIALACVRAGTLDPLGLPLTSASQEQGRAQLSDALFTLIATNIAQDQPGWHALLNWALYLRKGLNNELLERLANGVNIPGGGLITPDMIASFRQLPIVKRVGNYMLTLHDELYDLLFARSDSGRDARFWYQTAIEDLDRRIEATTASSTSTDGYQLPLQQTLQTERLFYRMCLNPLEGYQDYRELSISAIRSHAPDFDALLRAELVRFFDDQSPWGRHYRKQIEIAGLAWARIGYDDAIRWIYRCCFAHIEGVNRYERALGLAGEVRVRYDLAYEHDILAATDLQVAELEAKLYLEATTTDREQIDRAYRTITERLSTFLTTAAGGPAGASPLSQIEQKHATLVLATAYTNWSYTERLLQHYGRAVEYNTRALRLYARLGSEVDLTRAFSLNNGGYARGLQGELERGIELIEAARQIYARLGVQHSVAIALNTRSRLELQLDRASQALSSVLQARKIFETVDSRRNLALCAHAEGNVRRWIAYTNRAQPALSEREYGRAIACYKQALAIFASLSSRELLRQVEFLQSLGCAYRSRGFAQFQRGKPAHRDMNLARRYLTAALELCPPEQHGALPIVPALLEDIAVTYVNEERFADALDYLARARAAIPAIYRIDDTIGLNDTLETSDQKVYWLRLGQVELQYAMCRFGQKDAVSACARLVRAFACVLAFSPRAPQLQALRALGRRELMAVGSVEMLQQLRTEAYWSARRLNLAAEPFGELTQLFDEVIENIELGIGGQPSGTRLD